MTPTLVQQILTHDALTDSQRLAMLRIAAGVPDPVDSSRIGTNGPPLPSIMPNGVHPPLLRRPRTKPRTKLHETWRHRRDEARKTQQEFATALGISYAVLRTLEGGYSRSNRPPAPEVHADAEAKYQRWLDAQTRPAKETT